MTLKKYSSCTVRKVVFLLFFITCFSFPIFTEEPSSEVRIEKETTIEQTVRYFIGDQPIDLQDGQASEVERAPSSKTPEAVADQASILLYEVLNTVDYRGNNANFSSQAAGVLSIEKIPIPTGEAAYNYALSAGAFFHEDMEGVEWSMPVTNIIRDPATEQFIGGDDFFENHAIVANSALTQVYRDLQFDGRVQKRSFRLNPKSSDFPSEFSYSIQGTRQQIKEIGTTLAVLALSDPFFYTDPQSGAVIHAEHRVLVVLDQSMDSLYYMCSNFTARFQGEEIRIEALMTRLDNGRMVSLEGLDQTFFDYFYDLKLETGDRELASTNALPLWAMHSLAVRGAADIIAGAAIEGKSNFAITGTIGAILLVDAGASLATAAMYEAGWIDWKWDGIPNYIGQGAGLASAAAYSTATGREADYQTFREVGGIGGDVASLFIPTHLKTKVLKNTVKTVSLGAKKLRIGDQGMRAVRTGQTFLETADNAKRMNDAFNLLKAFKIGYDLAGLFPETAVSEKDPLTGAFNQAAGEGKLVMLFFTADWCPPSKIMKTDVISASAVRKVLAAHYVFLIIETDNDPHTAQKYGIHSIPTVVVLDAGGKEITRFIGFRSQEDFIAVINTIFRNY